jgi:hypothetical protein
MNGERGREADAGTVLDRAAPKNEKMRIARR